jgi:hypothetical protein
MSKPGPPKSWSIAQRRRRDHKARLDRIARLHDKQDMQRALMLIHEERGERKEVRKCKARLRTIEQQLRYIDIGAPSL